MRIDKFLKNSRIIKRRTVAKEACEQGRVDINGRTAKPGSEVFEGDIVKISFASCDVTVKILSIKDHVTKEESGSIYEIIT